MDDGASPEKSNTCPLAIPENPLKRGRNLRALRRISARRFEVGVGAGVGANSRSGIHTGQACWGCFRSPLSPPGIPKSLIFQGLFSLVHATGVPLFVDHHLAPAFAPRQIAPRRLLLPPDLQGGGRYQGEADLLAHQNPPRSTLQGPMPFRDNGRSQTEAAEGHGLGLPQHGRRHCRPRPR